MTTQTISHLPTRRAILLTPVIAALAAGCADERDEPEPVPDAELVTSWSESRFDWVAEIGPIATVVLSTVEQVDRWIEGVGIDPDAAAEAMPDVDLTTHFVVAGGYAKCQEYSVVGVTDDGGVTFTVRSDDEQVSCAWSPYTIDVWSVPLEATGGTAPGRVTTMPIDGDAVGELVLKLAESGGVQAGPLRDAVGSDTGRLVTTRKHLESLVEDLGLAFPDDDSPEDLPHLALLDLDIDQVVLVVAGFANCQSGTQVLADLDTDPVLLQWRETGDDQVMCEWSPYTVHVWAIERSVVGEAPVLVG